MCEYHLTYFYGLLTFASDSENIPEYMENLNVIRNYISGLWEMNLKAILFSIVCLHICTVFTLHFID